MWCWVSLDIIAQALLPLYRGNTAANFAGSEELNVRDIALQAVLMRFMGQFSILVDKPPKAYTMDSPPGTARFRVVWQRARAGD